MRRGGKVPLPYSASRHYCIIPPIARTALCFHPPPPLSFRLSERQRTHGEISHIVCMFRNEHGHAYTNRAFIAYPGDFSTAHGLIPCSARNDMLRRGCRPRFTRLAQSGICRRRVAAAMFRERALLHYPARCADNRNVILSRRACGASKNLPRLPQSDYNALMPAYLYTKLYYIPARSFDYVPRYSLGTPLRMTGYAAFMRLA